MVENEPDKRRGSRFMMQFRGLPLPGSALVSLLPKSFIERERTVLALVYFLPPLLLERR